MLAPVYDKEEEHTTLHYTTLHYPTLYYTILSVAAWLDLSYILLCFQSLLVSRRFFDVLNTEGARWDGNTGKFVNISPPCSSLYRWGERWSRSCWNMCRVAPWTVTPLPRSTGPHSKLALHRHHPLDVAWWEFGNANSPLLNTHRQKKNTWTSLTNHSWQSVCLRFFESTHTNTFLLLGLGKRFGTPFFSPYTHKTS